MAKDFLSQDEVDALLNGVSGESEETHEEEQFEGVRPYNLATQERIVRGRMPTLEIINERFARMLRLGLFNFVRRTAEISVGPVRVVKYADFVRNLVSLHLAGEDHSERLWALVNFEIWLRRFFDTEPQITQIEEMDLTLSASPA